VDASAAPTRWLRVSANWLADVVTGATPRTYGSLDVVSAATSFSELRNVVGAQLEATAGPAAFRAGYSYGTEHDYHSHTIRAGLKLDLLQHNLLVDLGYDHSFDSICDLNQPGVPVTLRQPLDNPTGCFSSLPGLTTESLNVDALELSLTQTFTRRLVGTLVGTYQHLDGFQSNPYRRVRLDGGLMQAQESHPRLRDRGAVTARLRYGMQNLDAALGFDLRLYRDTWGVEALTSELSWDQAFKRGKPDWRWAVRARGHVQSGALFYRDAGSPGSYETAGPVGTFFTADQELAPLADLIVGARFVHVVERPRQRRIWRMFESGEWSFVLDYMKTFALTPDPPNFVRINYWVTGLVLGVSASGRF
jgi:hypothetical protein